MNMAKLMTVWFTDKELEDAGFDKKQAEFIRNAFRHLQDNIEEFMKEHEAEGHD